MKDRLKEIKYLIYCKSEIIKQEADMIMGYKKLERDKQKRQ